MARRTKMEEVYHSSKPAKEEIGPSKTKSEEEAFIRVNFNISKDQKEKLKQYTKEIAPAHLKVSKSQLIRYMIENFDVSRAQEDFFKKKY